MKVKLFANLGVFGGLAKFESQINEFLAENDSKIKIIDVKFQAYGTSMSALLVYEEIN